MTVFSKQSAEPASDEVRIEVLWGHEWLVAPVVLVREGVLNGGYLDYDEILASEPGWNGRPVTAPPDEGTEAANLAPNEASGHPIDGLTDAGTPAFVSANREPFIEDMHVGMILDAEARDDLPTPEDEMSERGLVGDAWIDLERSADVGAHAKRAAANVAQGEALDVSTGYFQVPIEAPAGNDDGERYDVVQTDIMPDHLALLPNERGACSWEDGCGAAHPGAVAASNAEELAEAIGVDTDDVGETDGNGSAPYLTGHTDDARRMIANSAASWIEDACGCDHGDEDEPEGDTAAETDAEGNHNMTHDIQTLAERTAFDRETLEGWNEDDLETLADTLDANDDDGGDDGGSDGDGDGDTDPDGDDGGDDADDDGPDGDDDTEANSEVAALRDRIETLEAEREAERREGRRDHAETVAAHTEHTADELVDNTEEFPDAALETLAETVAPAGNAGGGPYAGAQGNRVNFLGQAGGSGEGDMGGNDDPESDGHTSGLAAMAKRGTAGGDD